MFRRTSVLAGGVALVAAFLAVPAQAASYGVVLRTDVTKADVHDTFRLSGEVTGSGAGSKKLIVQRKIGSGAWTNYSTLTTRPTGTFAKVFEMTSPGAKQFRVLAPKTSKLTTGTSNTKTVTGYSWLSLAKRGTEIISVRIGSSSSFFDLGLTGINVTARVDGHDYPHSIRFSNITPDGSSGAASLIVANLNGLCDEASFGYGLTESTPEETPDQPFIAVGATDPTSTTAPEYYVEPGEDPLATRDHVKVRTPISSDTNYFAAGILGTSGESPATVVLTTPRVHCSAYQLPDSDIAEDIFTSPTARSSATAKAFRE